MKDINDKFKDLLQKSSNEDSYIYEYFSKDEALNSYKDNYRQTKYGSSREGFEQFKKEGLNIAYPGEVSYREYNGGFVLEKKIQKSNKLTMDSKKLYEDFYKEVVEKLNVKDEVSFKFYIEEIPILEMSSFQYYKGKAEALNEILSKYEKDKDYKKFLDKVIK